MIIDVSLKLYEKNEVFSVTILVNCFINEVSNDNGVIKFDILKNKHSKVVLLFERILILF